MAEAETTSGNGDFGQVIAGLPEGVRSHAALTGVKDAAGFTAILDGHVARSKPFAEQLPKDIAGEAAFKDLKSWDDVAKSYLNAQKMIGVPKDLLLRLPAAGDDKPESWAPVYDRLGRPKAPGEYKLTVPQGATIDENVAKPIYETAHSLGLTQKQLDGMYGKMREIGEAQNKAATEAITKALSDAEAGLKTEWGAAYEQKLTLAGDAVAHFEKDIPGLKQALDDTGLGNHPALAKLFERIGATLKEDGKIAGRASSDSALSSPVEAQQKISALRQDPNFTKAYLERNHPDHAKAVEQMKVLHEQAYPEQNRAA